MGLRNMCCSRTPLLSSRRAFYSSQTEVNAWRSNCLPACACVSVQVCFSIGRDRVGGGGAVRRERGGAGESWWKNKPLAIITGNGLRHPLLRLAATHPPFAVYLSHCCYLSCSFDLFFFPQCLLSFLSLSTSSSNLLSHS